MTEQHSSDGGLRVVPAEGVPRGAREESLCARQRREGLRTRAHSLDLERTSRLTPRNQANQVWKSAQSVPWHEVRAMFQPSLGLLPAEERKDEKLLQIHWTFRPFSHRLRRGQRISRSSTRRLVELGVHTSCGWSTSTPRFP